MGFFTVPLAELVGALGRVIAVDLQPKMIAGLKRRVAKAGLSDRVETRVVSADSLMISDLASKVDFILAFALVHEMPSSSHFFREVGAAAKLGPKLLLAEPAGHVKPAEFDAELADAAKAGFRVVEKPVVKRSHAALLQKA
jgi:protein-L-isoaspartate O-methyltransferase